MKNKCTFPFLWAVILLGIVSIPQTLTAQQKSPQRGYLSTGMLWNPAMTAPGNYWEAGVLYSQQWVSFPGAPQTAQVYAQVPFPGLNMAAGLAFTSDKAGPLSDLGLQFNYAYKINTGLYEEDQLSIGLSAKGGQFRFDPNNVIAEDKSDQILTDQATNKIRLDYGFGLFYTTHNTFQFDKSHLYAGVAVDQLSALFTKEEAENILNLKSHFHGLVGYRFIKYYTNIEPALFLDMTGSKLINAGATLRYERDAEFWLNTAVELDGAMRLGAGWIHNRGRLLGSGAGSLRSGAIYLGAEAEYGVLNPIGGQQGISFYLFLAYRNQER